MSGMAGPATSVGGGGPASPGEPLSQGRRRTGADVHNRTDESGLIWDHRAIGRERRIETMLFTMAVLVAISGALIIHKARVAGRVNQADLGWMSAQWLAEHRASHPS